MTESTPTSMRHGAFRIAGRAGWALTDQAISSFTNFAMGVLIARSTSAEAFGAFTLAFSTYLIVMNLARASGTQPLVIRFSGVDDAEWRRGTTAATGTMFAIGVAAGIACIVLGLAIGQDAGPSFVALGVALPALMLQDSWRFAFFAAGRDQAAVLTDMVWAASLIPILLILSAVAPGTPQAVLGWGLSAVISAPVGIALSRVVPSPMTTRSWLHEHRDLVGRYSLETAISLSATQIPVYVVSLTTGLAEAGSLRAAQLLLGPMQVVVQAAHLIAVPEGVRIRRRNLGRFPLAIAVFSVGLTSVVLVWVAILMLLPNSVGEALLGASWSSAQLVILPLGLSLAAAGFSSGQLVGLRVLADAIRSLRARSVDATIGITLSVGGALIGGAVGAAWGFAVSGVLASAVWAAFFVRSERAHRDIPTR